MVAEIRPTLHRHADPESVDAPNEVDGISPSDLAELRASAISDEVIQARGYRTINEPRDLSEWFAPYQRRPGLLIPIRDVTGHIATCQLKPASPRSNKGKQIKYETAKDGRACIDVPAAVLPLLRRTDVPLWITEGCKKVDSVLSNGIPCIVGLTGVWNWLSQKTRLPEWDEIPLKGRTVVIAFDSDVMTKASVRTALERFSKWLRELKGAKVRYLVLPTLAGRAKCGLDDWFAEGHARDELTHLVVDELPDVPEADRAGAARLVVRRMSEVEPRQVESLWPGYIVKRKFNLLAGYGGVGKGQMMMNLIARGSRGDPMPTEEHGTVFRTLILAAEDDPHEDIRVRLDANGANLDNISIIDGVAEGDDGVVKWVDIKRHLPLVEELAEREGFDLLYIDPLSSYMPGTTRRDAGEVRDTLGYIQRLIDATGVTVVGTLHLGKATMDRKGAMKILDSVEFVNAARNVLAINDLPDEHQPDNVLDDASVGRRKVLEVVKANSTIPGPPQSFSRPLNAAVQWHGIAPVGFDESFTTSKPKGARRQDAKDWLWEYLRGGMRLASEVTSAAKQTGISGATLTRAKAELNIQSKRTDFNGPWYWMLPTKSPGGKAETTAPQDAHPAAEDTHTQDVSIFEGAHMVDVSTFGDDSQDAHQHHTRDVSIMGTASLPNVRRLDRRHNHDEPAFTGTEGPTWEDF